MSPVKHCARILGVAWIPTSLLALAQPSPTIDSRLPQRSDVVFMYQADRGTYQDYGATVLAWGGTPDSRSLNEATGVAFFGSVGMVTEFARYHRRFPDTYLEGVCRDLEGKPFKVPWLTDHQHEGIPYWWCCTQQPQFRTYLEERVIETVRAGARGVHIDDHLGSAGALFLGGCWCDRCVEGFRTYLAALPRAELDKHGPGVAGDADPRPALRAWVKSGPDGKPRRLEGHPLWHAWSVYQCKAAAAYMRQLKELAARTAGRPVPFSANAGVLWPNHLVDYQALDFISAEIDHHAGARAFSNLPLFAYRLADAVDRPLASTASGQDWAFIKAGNLPGLVQGWIALGYAAGHSLMAPHRQWCYTTEKGTHWYAGPKEKFAPLYRFVRRNAAVFDGWEAYADVALVMPHRSFQRDRERWFALGDRLSGLNVPWRLVLGGDDLVSHPIDPRSLQGVRVIVNPEPEAIDPLDRARVEEAARKTRCVQTLEPALAGLTPAVNLEGAVPVRLLPRVRPGAAVVHVLNLKYEPSTDRVATLPEVTLRLNLEALGVPKAVNGRLLAFDHDPKPVDIREGRVQLTDLGLWQILVIEAN